MTIVSETEVPDHARRLASLAECDQCYKEVKVPFRIESCLVCLQDCELAVFATLCPPYTRCCESLRHTLRPVVGGFSPDWPSVYREAAPLNPSFEFLCSHHPQVHSSLHNHDFEVAAHTAILSRQSCDRCDGMTLPSRNLGIQPLQHAFTTMLGDAAVRCEIHTATISKRSASSGERTLCFVVPPATHLLLRAIVSA